MTAKSFKNSAALPKYCCTNNTPLFGTVEYKVLVGVFRGQYVKVIRRMRFIFISASLARVPTWHGATAFVSQNSLRLPLRKI